MNDFNKAETGQRIKELRLSLGFTQKELADQIGSAVSQDEVLGIINCCTGHPISLAEKVEQFIREKGLTIRLDYGAYPDRPYDSPVIYGDPTKIQKIMEITHQ